MFLLRAATHKIYVMDKFQEHIWRLNKEDSDIFYDIDGVRMKDLDFARDEWVRITDETQADRAISESMLKCDFIPESDLNNWM